MIYYPREDSFLLQAAVKEFAKGRVLDMGTGSGIQAATAAEKAEVKSVLAVDTQAEVVEHGERTFTNSKIKFLQSDLFNKVTGTFDTLIFNPPYLPDDTKLQDTTLDGGKQGYEIIERFLKEAKSHLNKDGIILLLFSSLTGREKVDELIQSNGFEAELISQQHIFFEDLLVYKVHTEK